jgi:hypothetical protein
VTDAERIAALERRLDEFESREAIARVIHRYPEAIRDASPMSVLELMLDDTVVELRHADPGQPSRSDLVVRYTGREAIRGSFAEQAGAEARVWPMIHNLRIEVDGDSARSTCVLHSAVWPAGKQYVGEYRDTFRRIDGKWYFASRAHIGFGELGGEFSREAHAAYQAVKAQAAET